MDKLKLSFFTDNDVKLLKSWLHKEHVKRWYEVPGLCSIEDWLTEVKGRNDGYSFITRFIAQLAGHPIGFCQYYRCGDAPDSWYGNTPLDGAYSIDYLIGEEAHLGKGLGKAIIALLVKEVFSLPDSGRIIVQPDGDNKASCNALISNGFLLDTVNNIYILTK